MAHMMALQNLTIRVETMLPTVESLSNDDLATILLVYDEAIRPYFMGWLGLAFSGARSIEARLVLRDNLFEEVEEDHPAMLREFTASIRQMVDPDDLARRLYIIRSESRALTMLAAELPLNAIVLIAALEVSSLAFVTWLAEAAERLAIHDLAYVEEHGEADIVHADDLQRVLPTELRTWGLDDATVQSLLDHVLPLVLEFLKHIFHSHRALVALTTK